MPEKPLIFPLLSHVKWKRARQRRCQTVNRGQEARLILNQLCESIIKSMNSQCECSWQMDQHLSAIWSSKRVRFIFQACLSHFSCPVLEGTACICGFRMQEIANDFIAGETGLCELNSPRCLAFFLLRMQTRWEQVWQGVSVLVVLSKGRMRLAVMVGFAPL